MEQALVRPPFPRRARERRGHAFPGGAGGVVVATLAWSRTQVGLPTAPLSESAGPVRVSRADTAPVSPVPLRGSSWAAGGTDSPGKRHGEPGLAAAGFANVPGELETGPAWKSFRATGPVATGVWGARTATQVPAGASQPREPPGRCGLAAAFREAPPLGRSPRSPLGPRGRRPDRGRAGLRTRGNGTQKPAARDRHAASWRSARGDARSPPQPSQAPGCLEGGRSRWRPRGPAGPGLHGGGRRDRPPGGGAVEAPPQGAGPGAPPSSQRDGRPLPQRRRVRWPRRPSPETQSGDDRSWRVLGGRVGPSSDGPGAGGSSRQVGRPGLGGPEEVAAVRPTGEAPRPGRARGGGPTEDAAPLADRRAQGPREGLRGRCGSGPGRAPESRLSPQPGHLQVRGLASTQVRLPPGTPEPRDASSQLGEPPGRPRPKDANACHVLQPGPPAPQNVTGQAGPTQRGLR